jgi:hypothetical protein
MKTSLKFPTILTLLCGAGLITHTTSAAPKRAARDPGVNARQAEQQKRIHEGVKSGELTQQEAKGLEKEERGIRQEERQFKSDGVLTADERAKLNADLDKTSHDINTEKHDAEGRAHKPHDPAVNARQHEQEARIRQGARSGQLTRDGAKGLQKEERAVRQEERDFKSDGKLTPEERAKLKTDLNKVSQDIYNEKHDGEVRPKAVPPATPSSAPVTK